MQLKKMEFSYYSKNTLKKPNNYCSHYQSLKMTLKSWFLQSWLLQKKEALKTAESACIIFMKNDNLPTIIWCQWQKEILIGKYLYKIYIIL